MLRRPKELESNTDEIYAQLFGNDPDGTVQLQLSCFPNLRSSILLVEEQQTGLVRCYYRSSSNLYYCSSCRGKSNRTAGKRILVKASVGERGVIHHGSKSHLPECKGQSKLEIITQQLKRRLNLWERERQ